MLGNSPRAKQAQGLLFGFFSIVDGALRRHFVLAIGSGSWRVSDSATCDLMTGREHPAAGNLITSTWQPW